MPSGSSPGSGSGGSNTGTMTARIDGDQWTATSVVVNNRGGAAPLLTITGTGPIAGAPATQTTSIALAINNPGLGTFQLDAVGTQTGSLTLQISNLGGSSVWVASPVTPSSTGTVIITTFTATRAAGSFAATALPSSGANDSIAVTNGAFDVRF
jgi:hypothetical protein